MYCLVGPSYNKTRLHYDLRIIPTRHIVVQETNTTFLHHTTGVPKPFGKDAYRHSVKLNFVYGSTHFYDILLTYH